LIEIPDMNISEKKLDQIIRVNEQSKYPDMYIIRNKEADTVYVGTFHGKVKTEKDIDASGLYYDLNEKKLKVVDPTHILDNILEDIESTKETIGKPMIHWDKMVNEFAYGDIPFSDLKMKYSDEDNALTYIIKWLVNASGAGIDFWTPYFESSLDFSNERRIVDEKGTLSIGKFGDWLDIFDLKYSVTINEDSSQISESQSTNHNLVEVEKNQKLNIFSTLIIKYINDCNFSPEYIQSLFVMLPNKKNNYLNSLKSGKTRFDMFLKWKMILG